MLKAVVSVTLAILAFFTNLKGPAMADGPLDDGGLRVQYGTSSAAFMDVYFPETADTQTDIAVLIHGGAWMNGDQTMFTKYAVQAAELGYVGVTVNYSDLRYHRTVPQMVDEIHLALGKLKSVLEQRNISPGKAAIIGHSAGAQLALLYGYTHKENCPFNIGFLTALSAPADIMYVDGEKTMIEKYRHLLGTALSGENMSTLAEKKHSETFQAAERSISPLLLVTPDVPPTLLIHGDADTVVPYQNSVELLDALQNAGVDSELVTFEGLDHFYRPRTAQMYETRLAAILRWADQYL